MKKIESGELMFWRCECESGVVEIPTLYEEGEFFDEIEPYLRACDEGAGVFGEDLPKAVRSARDWLVRFENETDYKYREVIGKEGSRMGTFVKRDLLYEVVTRLIFRSSTPAARKFQRVVHEAYFNKNRKTEGAGSVLTSAEEPLVLQATRIVEISNRLVLLERTQKRIEEIDAICEQHRQRLDELYRQMSEDRGDNVAYMSDTGYQRK